MITDNDVLEKLEILIKNKEYLSTLDKYVLNQNKKYVKTGVTTASKESIRNTETFLGFELPELLFRIYSEISNGLIGPGNGMFGVNPCLIGCIDDNYKYEHKIGNDFKKNFGSYSGYYFTREIEGYETNVYHDFFWIYGTISMCEYDSSDLFTDFSVVNCLEENFPVYRMDYFSLFENHNELKGKRLNELGINGDNVFGGSYKECDSFKEWISNWCDSAIKEYIK